MHLSVAIERTKLLQIVSLLILWGLAANVPVPHIPNPSSRLLILLVLLLPGIWRLARFMLYKALAAEDRAVLIPGLALVLWVFSTHLCGILLQNFYLGLWMGTFWPGAIGYAIGGKFAHRRSDFPVPSFGIWIGAIIGGALMVPNLITMDTFDKLNIITGHFSITEEMLNGIYPPRHLSFAQLVLPYHYGVDTLFAMVAAVFRLRTDWAVDVTTLILWSYSLMLFGHLCSRIFGERTGGWGAFIGGYAAGLGWVAGINNAELPDILTYPAVLGEFAFLGRRLAFFVIQNFFQQPWALGTPVALVLFTTLLSLTQTRYINRYAAVILLILIVVLGLAQTALYLGMMGAIVGTSLAFWAVALLRQRERPQFQIDILIVTLVGIAACMLLNANTSIIEKGFAGSIIKIDPKIAGSWWRTLQWNIATFGLTIPLCLAGMLIARRMRFFAFCMASGGVFIVNRYAYAHSWDIVKFATVANIFMSIYSAGFTASLITSARSWVRIVGMLLAIPLCLASVMYCAMGPLGEIYPEKYYFYPEQRAIAVQWKHNPPPEDYVNAVAWLRTQIKAGDVVMTPAMLTHATAISGGIPVLLADQWTWSFGFPGHMIQHREALYNSPQTHAPQEYYNVGIRYITTRSGDWIFGEFENVILNWQAQGAVELIADFGPSKVYRLLPPKP